MKKKLTRAMKREIATNICNERTRKYEFRYGTHKGREAIEIYTETERAKRDSILNIVDSGISTEDFLDLLEGNFFKDFNSRIFDEDKNIIPDDLLNTYNEDMEDYYPDILTEDESLLENLEELKALEPESK